MTTSSLLKTVLNSSVADGLYNEISSRYARYYYFLGRTITWETELTPPYPTDSYSYELQTRNEIITLKEINPTDVSYVINRYNWANDSVYDQYDDQYSTEVQGINLIGGGTAYSIAPNIYIGSTGSVQWNSNTTYYVGDLVNSGSNYYIVNTPGISDTVTAPTHTSGTATNGTVVFKYVSVTDGSGTGATATCSVLNGSIIDITLTHRGVGYTSMPSVVITGTGSGAYATSVITVAVSGTQKLENSKFYVITDEYNVYKCLNNNYGSASSVKPTGTGVDAFNTPDGYVWKFLYNVPVALRNKFLTDSYIPVVTAVQNQFYSNGVLQTINLDQAGSGYASGTIVVQGDGYSAANPVYLTDYSLTKSGSGYTGPITILVDAPFTGVFSWQANSTVIVGQKLSNGANVYQVSVSGLTSSIGPVHRSGIVANGTAALEFIGSIPQVDATLTDGSISNIIFYGMLREIDMVTGGSGYTSAPTVNLSGNGTGIAVMANGSVSKVVITDPGNNYTSAPTITFGVEWSASTSVTIGEQIYYSSRLYTVSASGTTGTISPTHTTGSQTNGTATLTYVGIPAAATVSIKYGSGYSSAPSVTISNSPGVDFNGEVAKIEFESVKSEAKIIPIFNNGALVSTQIDDGGVGYSHALLTVEGDGTEAAVSADLSVGNINSLQANIELLTVDGGIMNIPVISGGYGYSDAVVTITGDGAGATATATISSGAISKIKMVNYGSGYRWAKITITSASGYGAKARAIISPFGGHGKNALKDLFARSLMFYGNVSTDKNQGFVVNNDYRQIGIIKSPRKYGTTANLTNVFASACWVLSASTDSTIFPEDSIIIKSGGSARYRIVVNTGSSLLVQSIDNSIPVNGDSFSNEVGDIFSASVVTPPTVDKYSGDLLFIDNKAAFTPTSDQTVTLRTVIKF
jgi:hypothetical protein